MSEKNNTKLFNELYPWISKQFFQNIIKCEISDEKTNNILIKNYTISNALGTGENYASQMLRTKVNYMENGTNQSISFIIKTIINNDPIIERFISEMNFFNKEINIYQNVLPAVKKLLNSIGDEDINIAAKCYDSNLDLSYLVFEDLSLKGYDNVNRRIGFNVNYLKKVLDKIGRWHAATAVLIDQIPSITDQFNDNDFLMKSSRCFVENSYITVKDVTEQLQNFQFISKKLDNNIGRMCQAVYDAGKFNINDFNVIYHGDLWTNNILFLHNDNNCPADAVLCDFQLVSYGSAALDLTMLLFSSSHEDINEFDWNLLIQYYHQILSQTLRKLNYTKKIPTLTDIHDEFLRKGVCKAVIGICVMGIRNLENVKENIMLKFMENSEKVKKYRLEMITKPECRKSLEYLLIYFDSKGFFG